MKLRAVKPLLLEVIDGAIVASSPMLRKRLRIGPRVAELLIAARSGMDVSNEDPVVAKLLNTGFLVPHEADEPPLPAPWRQWGATAWSFHTRTRDTSYVATDPQRLEAYEQNFAHEPMPSPVRPAASGEILLLPRIRSPLNPSFREVLEGRRTHRNFTDEQIGLDAFADLLLYSFAPLRFADARQMGMLHLRAAASGGARHETEAFVFVFKVAGIDQGLYHYDNIRHGLVPLQGDGSRERLEHLTHDQGFFRHAGFGVLTVAVADRMSWKYHHPSAFRVLLHNVGHVAQVFAMTATALGLGAALTAAIRNTEADDLLRLDSPREFTTFALACGVPVLTPSGMPVAVRTPRRPWLLDQG